MRLRIEIEVDGEREGGLLDAGEVAALLGTNETVLNNWRAQGRGPVFEKQGRFIRYRPEAVSQWLTDAKPWTRDRRAA